MQGIRQTVTVSVPEDGLFLVLRLVARDLESRRLARASARGWQGSHRRMERAAREELDLDRWFRETAQVVGFEVND